jgi:hypothetical protein
VASLAPGALLAVVGFGAPQPGTYVEVGGGPGAYHYSGACEGPHNYANFVALQARARHLEPNGLVVVGEAAGQRDEVVRSDTVSQVGRRETYGVLALRIGFEGRYGGFEVGPGVIRGGIDDGRLNPSTNLVPSVNLWLGRYGVAHAWASVLADRTLPMNRVAGFGIGHASPRVRASLGLAGSGGKDGTFIADADIAVVNGLWLGAGWQFAGGANTWGLLGRVGFFWGGDSTGATGHRPVEEAPGVDPSVPAPVPQPVAPAPDTAPAPSVEVQGTGVDAGA